MYEAVRPYPRGDSTVARHAQTAARCGYDGIVVRIDADEVGEAPRVEPVEHAVDVVPAVEADAADRERCGTVVQRERDRVPLLIARGGSADANRFAAERERVDVLLTRPPDVPDHATIGVAAGNGVRIAVDCGPILRESDGERVRAIDALRTLVGDLQDLDAPYVVTGTPASHLALRAPRELAALGTALDADPDWLADGLAAWSRLIERNRDRLSDAFVEAGVYRGGPNGDGDSR